MPLGREAGKFTRELFVLHALEDMDFVQNELIQHLTLAKDQVLLSSRIPLGSIKLEYIENAITESKVTLIVASPNYFLDAYSLLHEAMATHRSLEGGSRLIPVIAAPCRLPARLAMRTSLDFTIPSERAAQRALLFHEYSHWCAAGSPAEMGNYVEDIIPLASCAAGSAPLSVPKIAESFASRAAKLWLLPILLTPSVCGSPSDGGKGLLIDEAASPTDEIQWLPKPVFDSPEVGVPAPVALVPVQATPTEQAHRGARTLAPRSPKPTMERAALAFAHQDYLTAIILYRKILRVTQDERAAGGAVLSACALGDRSLAKQFLSATAPSFKAAFNIKCANLLPRVPNA